MADTPISAFITYSRTDSAFIDRLEADLRAYGFDTWVDRQHLEGGVDWARLIEQQIVRCEALVVALSPDAITSTWVRREIIFALNAGKHIIPIIARPVASTPIEIVNLQYIDLSADYASGLQDLRVALLKVRTLPLPRPMQMPQPLLTLPDAGDPVKGLVQIPSPPLPLNPDLSALFRQAQAALAHRNLDLAEALLGQIVEQQKDFGYGLADEELQRVRKQLEPLRVERLLIMANDAHARGAWGQEIGALRALLELPELKDSEHVWEAPQPVRGWKAPQPLDGWGVPSQPVAAGDEPAVPSWLRSQTVARRESSQTDWTAGTAPVLPSASLLPKNVRVDSQYLHTRLARAEECQKWSWLYDNACTFAQAKDDAATRMALAQLWEKAPSFGDPAHIATANVTLRKMNAALIINSGANSAQSAGRRLVLNKDRITIGRHRESDVFLEDLAASRLHTTIIRNGTGEYIVRDESSANGTYVNGHRVNECVLKDGDEIMIGQSILLFRRNFGG